ncbi:unnamed protein product [Rhodiola kirilowii]
MTKPRGCIYNKVTRFRTASVSTIGNSLLQNIFSTRSHSLQHQLPTDLTKNLKPNSLPFSLNERPCQQFGTLDFGA